jgi:hypothetical protein
MADSCEIVSLSSASAADPSPDTTKRRLMQALDLLLAGASAARAERALRAAIITLVNPQRGFQPADDGPLRDLLTPVPRPVAPEVERWPEMRQQLRATFLPADTKRREQIALELLVTPHTLINACSRNDCSEAFAKRLAAWLAKGGNSKGNGKAHPRTYQLAEAQRDRLRLLLGTMTNADFRRSAGVSIDIAYQAADGVALPPDLITRLVRLVDADLEPS